MTHTREQNHEEPSEERKHGKDVNGERRAHRQGGGHAAVTATTFLETEKRFECGRR